MIPLYLKASSNLSRKLNPIPISRTTRSQTAARTTRSGTGHASSAEFHELDWHGKARAVEPTRAPAQVKSIKKAMSVAAVPTRAPSRSNRIEKTVSIEVKPTPAPIPAESIEEAMDLTVEPTRSPARAKRIEKAMCLTGSRASVRAEKARQRRTRA